MSLSVRGVSVTRHAAYSAAAAIPFGSFPAGILCCSASFSIFAAWSFVRSEISASLAILEMYSVGSTTGIVMSSSPKGSSLLHLEMSLRSSRRDHPV